MVLIQWKSEYETGIAKIDMQHKELIKMINELHEAMGAGKGKEVLGGLLERLINYTIMHFSTEEDLMLKYKYEESNSHLAKHKDLRDKVSELKKNYDSGKVVISMNVMTFLKEWLQTHIVGTDVKFGKFLKENGEN